MRYSGLNQKYEVNMSIFDMKDLSYLDDFALKYSQNKQSIFNNSIAEPSSTISKPLNTLPVLNSSGNKPNFIKKRLLENILPFRYDNAKERILATIFTDKKNQDNILNAMSKEPLRDDAWRMYLGYPQKHNTFSLSKYKPTKNKNQNSTYYRYNMPIHDLLKIFMTDNNDPIGYNELAEDHDVMGHYTVDIGNDDKGNYLSIYDKWDFPFSEYIPDGIVGKPFEIYDRIYENELYSKIDKGIHSGFDRSEKDLDSMSQEYINRANWVFHTSPKAKKTSLTDSIYFKK